MADEQMKYSDKQIKEFINGMYDGTVSTIDLPEDLYFAISDYLKKGVYEGFGGNLEKFEGKDLELLTELRENVYMFSAAKIYQQVKDISSQLYNENDELRSRSEFNKIGREMFDTWNNDWGKSEYNTAIGQASMASKWQDIEASKDILPTLVFSVVQPCDECAPFDGFSAPVDDPIWDWASPLLHFNCMCALLQEDEDYEVSDKDRYNEVIDMKDDISPVFQMNPGKDKVIFSDEHPYFDVAPKDREYASNNFNLPIPPVSIEQYANETITSGELMQMAQPLEGLSIPEAKVAMQDYDAQIGDDVKKAVKAYTGGDYIDINYHLRKGGEISDQNKSNIQYIDSYLKGAPKVNAESYRGLQLDDRQYTNFKNYKKGDIYSDKGFVSTSYDNQAVKDFLGSGQWQVEMTIKGKSGVLIESLSQKKAEKEILFGQQSNFKIESIKIKEKAGIYGKIFVTLREM